MSHRRSDYRFELPESLIAQTPAARRSESRLLVLDANGCVAHRRFTDLVDLLAGDDLLVVNDTRVLPARLHAIKDSGGHAEVLVERLLDDHEMRCQVRVSKPLKRGRTLAVEGGGTLTVAAREGDLYRLESVEPVRDLLARVGRVPLPPYILREPDAADAERYQTVFARREGAVAAPTAGLHFDEPTLDRLAAKRVARVSITLHVAAGTFQPVRSDDIREHRMHAEWLEVSPDVVAAVEGCRRRSGRVVAVGTTVVRALESAASRGTLEPLRGDTDLFIRPGHAFRAVDALLTNFHLPESSLLMLVSAFGGRQAVLAAYRAAVAERYRFFSYGDAMFLAGPASS